MLPHQRDQLRQLTNNKCDGSGPEAGLQAFQHSSIDIGQCRSDLSRVPQRLSFKAGRDDD